MNEIQTLQKVIDIAFDSFFDFDTADKSQVSSLSCKLFAEHMINLETERMNFMLGNKAESESK